MITFVLGACSSPSPGGREISALDTSYVYERIYKVEGIESPGISFYQRVLSQALATRCQMFPTDSRYTQDLFRSCGPFQAIPMGMSRVFFELDSGALGVPLFAQQNEVHFWDPPVCP